MDPPPAPSEAPPASPPPDEPAPAQPVAPTALEEGPAAEATTSLPPVPGDDDTLRTQPGTQ